MPVSLIRTLLRRFSLNGKFIRNRRGGITLAMALMVVPILLTAGIAVDFARISAARTLLQASVDTAATAGGGEWQLSEESTDAANVAQEAYYNTGSGLASIASQGTPIVSLYCSAVAAANGVQCGTSYPYSTNMPPKCGNSPEYCVVVSSTVTLTNSLLAMIIPSELLSATAYASLSSPNQKQQQHGGGGKYKDKQLSLGGAGAYVGNVSSDGTPDYSQPAVPNTACQTSPAFQYIAPSGNDGSTQCNILFLGDTAGDSVNSTGITTSATDPIEFLYVDYTGKYATAASEVDQTHYTTNLMVSTSSATSGFTYYPYGFTVPGSSTSCERHQANCTPSITQPTQLYGQCPGHNLYGSIFSSSDDPSNVPLADSINVFYSSYEELGEPPTYTTNHALTPFVTNVAVQQSVSGTTYYVEAVCPDWAIPSGSTISAPVSTNYVDNTNVNVADANIFATWYPTGLANEVAFTDSSNTTSAALTSGNGVYPNDVYPPAVAGCTPATSALDGGVTPAASDQWWGWDENDATPKAFSNLNTSYCDPTTPTGTPASNPVPTSVEQSTANTNCALLIEDLGTNVPQISVNGVSQAELPDYYNIITSDAAGTNVVALDPVYDDTTYTDALTGATIINTDTAGDTPSNPVAAGPAQSGTPTYATGGAVIIKDATVIPYGYSASGVAATPFNGTKYAYDDPADTLGTPYYLWIQQPAEAILSSSSPGTYDESPPGFTAHRCYNPQANGAAAGYAANSPTVAYTHGTNNNGTALDPVENPQYGAVFCNTSPPHTYALYWHDMGGFGVDLLGYYNLIVPFTCSTPPTSNAGGGGSFISG